VCGLVSRFYTPGQNNTPSDNAVSLTKFTIYVFKYGLVTDELT